MNERSGGLADGDTTQTHLRRNQEEGRAQTHLKRIQAEGQITQDHQLSDGSDHQQAWRNIHAEVTDYIYKELKALDAVEVTTDLPVVAAMVGLKHKVEEDLMQLQRQQAQEEEKEEEEWYTTQTVSNQEVIQDWELWLIPFRLSLSPWWLRRKRWRLHLGQKCWKRLQQKTWKWSVCLQKWLKS